MITCCNFSSISLFRSAISSISSSILENIRIRHKETSSDKAARDGQKVYQNYEDWKVYESDWSMEEGIKEERIEEE